MKGYFNQTALWRRITGYNDYGEPIFSSTLIKVRWEERQQITRDKYGENVVSEARAFCTEPVQIGDRLIYNDQEWTVINVRDGVGLNGNVVFREVLC